MGYHSAPASCSTPDPSLTWPWIERLNPGSRPVSLWTCYQTLHVPQREGPDKVTQLRLLFLQTHEPQAAAPSDISLPPSTVGSSRVQTATSWDCSHRQSRKGIRGDEGDLLSPRMPRGREWAEDGERMGRQKRACPGPRPADGNSRMWSPRWHAIRSARMCWIWNISGHHHRAWICTHAHTSPPDLTGGFEPAFQSLPCSCDLSWGQITLELVYLGQGVDAGPPHSQEPRRAAAVLSGPATGAAPKGRAAISAGAVIWGQK